MALNGWHWTIFGGIISIISAYVYFTVPKNGGPNYAMVLFFFIGIVFLVIGLVKLFFKKADDRLVFDAVNRSEQSNQVRNLGVQTNAPVKKDLSVQMDLVTSKEPLNKVEQAVAEMAKAQQKQTHHAHQGTHTLHTGHTNSYSKTHQYHGPVRPVIPQSPNANHPVGSHVANKTTAPVHGIACRGCGSANSTHANFCHTCGNRLK